jgi:hypothetical protein
MFGPPVRRSRRTIADSANSRRSTNSRPVAIGTTRDQVADRALDSDSLTCRCTTIDIHASGAGTTRPWRTGECEAIGRHGVNVSARHVSRGDRRRIVRVARAGDAIPARDDLARESRKAVVGRGVRAGSGAEQIAAERPLTAVNWIAPHCARAPARQPAAARSTRVPSHLNYRGSNSAGC